MLLWKLNLKKKVQLDDVYYEGSVTSLAKQWMMSQGNCYHRIWLILVLVGLPFQQVLPVSVLTPAGIGNPTIRTYINARLSLLIPLSEPRNTMPCRLFLDSATWATQYYAVWRERETCAHIDPNMVWMPFSWKYYTFIFVLGMKIGILRSMAYSQNKNCYKFIQYRINILCEKLRCCTVCEYLPVMVYSLICVKYYLCIKTTCLQRSIQIISIKKFYTLWPVIRDHL